MEDVADDTGRAVFDCLSAVLLLLTALLGAYLPRYLSSKGGGQSGTATSLAFHLGNMLSGGVMLSAGFCHLLADSLRQLAFIGRFPIATFLAAVGYLTTLLADQLVQVLTADPASATATSAGDSASSVSTSRQHKYTRLGNEDSSNTIELMRTQQTVEQTELNGSTAGDSHQLQHNVGWHESNDGLHNAITSAAAAVSGAALPNLLLPVSMPHTAAHANGQPHGSSSRPAAEDHDDDAASCIFASGSPRAISAASTAARPCSRTALTTAAAAQHPRADCKQVMQAGDHSSIGRGCRVAYLQSLQQQQEQEHVAQDVSADLSLPCSQLIMSSPRQQRQQQQQHVRVLDQQQQGGRCNHSSGHGDHSSKCSGWDKTAIGDTSSCGCCLGDIQQSVLDIPGAVNTGYGSGAWSQQCSQQQHHQQQQQHACRFHGGACAQHAEDMTEACRVARVAGHLELEVLHSGQPGAAHTHAHFQVLLSHQPLSFATTVLLACALCIHSILEGIALGAQQSMQSTRDIMLAIAAHKGLAAYALGASIVESKASATKFWTVVSMFAVATPIGIGIGYAFSNIGHGSVSAAMSALASGTFLYVALNEVIPKELEHPDGHRVLKVAALLLGFGLMSLLAVWA